MMDTYIYKADLWCMDCGVASRERLDLETVQPPGFDRDDESTYDSDEYPKGPYLDGGGEADTPCHCAAGAECVGAIELSDGHKVGAWLENPLTAEGARYVQEVMAEGSGYCLDLWAEWYSWCFADGV